MREIRRVSTATSFHLYSELNNLNLSEQERTGHFPKLIEDLAVRLGKPSSNAKDGESIFSAAAVAHGKLRYSKAIPPKCWYTSREYCR